MLPTKFQVNWPFGSGGRQKRFSRWLPFSHLGFPIGLILAIFDLQVTLMLPAKFQVNRPFASGEKQKIDFQDGDHRGHLGFPTKMIFSYF